MGLLMELGLLTVTTKKKMHSCIGMALAQPDEGGDRRSPAFSKNTPGHQREDHRVLLDSQFLAALGEWPEVDGHAVAKLAEPFRRQFE